MILARLTVVPPIKANLTFKCSHYLTLPEPHPATFPLDVCSLSEICLLLPFLMSGTLCHLLEPRKQPKTDDSRVHIFTCSDDEPTLIHYSSLLTPSDTGMTQRDAAWTHTKTLDLLKSQPIWKSLINLCIIFFLSLKQVSRFSCITLKTLLSLEVGK